MPPSTALNILEPFNKPDPDFQGIKKLAFKLHVHSDNYAAKLAQMCNPPGPHYSILLVCGGRANHYMVPTGLHFLN